MNPNNIKFNPYTDLTGLRNKTARNKRRLEKKKNNKK
jgi:hypothetical protein